MPSPANMRNALLLLGLSVGCASGPQNTARVSPDEPDEPGTLDQGQAYGSACVTQARGVSVHICNFHEVSPGIYRGARPSQQGMLDLAQLGVRTDIDLEKPATLVRAEAGYASKAGVDLVRKPMSYLLGPSDQTVDEILSILGDPRRQPVFVHCKLGTDRAGLIVALYRVYRQGWDPAEAWREMMELGFHRVWVGLSHYFEERTGYED